MAYNKLESYYNYLLSIFSSGFLRLGCTRVILHEHEIEIVIQICKFKIFMAFSHYFTC